MRDQGLGARDFGPCGRGLDLSRNGAGHGSDPTAALGDECRIPRFEVIGNVAEIAVHLRHESTKSAGCDARIWAWINMLRAFVRPPCALRMPPVGPLEQISQLRRGDDDRTAAPVTAR